ncbi:hypothetical protein CALCODRAFT_479724 [Calocera cornea HHB12733]|uniref:SNF2 family DNA-dependent ATPase domain-containing protein n=1 Tax=Calocera cornea HHB12733 TaxID=1353952 RepID=A0A165JDA0_9BASI|nr:hypothetical protein CALCODRAFT_479724 [Calocera cornea HHB12733]
MSHQQMLRHAARQLNVRQDKVPHQYIRQLQLHPEAYGQDSNFSLQLKDGDGFGLVHCHTCKKAIKLGSDSSRADGGHSMGIGSLEAYAVHCRSSNHRALRGASAAASSTSFPATRAGPDAATPPQKNSSSPYFTSRLPDISGMLSFWPSGSRKRASAFDSDGAVPETPPFKRIKLEPKSEEAEAPLQQESSELASPPRPRPKPGGGSMVALSTKPLQVVERITPTNVSTSAKLEYGVALHPFFTQTPNVASTVLHIAPNYNVSGHPVPPPAGALVIPNRSVLSTSRLKQENAPLTVKVEKEELAAQAFSDHSDQLSAANIHDTPTIPVALPWEEAEHGIADWIHSAALAETFEENATVQKSLQKLGLTEQAEKLPGMEISLLPHQIIGVDWMKEQETSQKIGHYGGILADEMGLGKTVQMIATMTVNLPTKGNPNGTLIVCPVGLLDQWKTEIETKTAGLYKPYVYHGPDRTKSYRVLQGHDVVLTTYHTLSLELPTSAMLKANDHPDNDMEDGHKCGPLLKAEWYRVVLDEAQVIRNRKTRASSAAARLHSTLRWCLTGTPIINTLSDAFSLMRVLRIRPWYEWQHFNQNIVKNERKNPALSGKRLQGVFKTCLLRRNKNSMLDGKRLIELPAKKVDTVVLDFSDEERAIYAMVEQKAQAVFNRFLRQGTVLKNYSHVFSLIMRLRQCACHPALIQEQYDEAMMEADDQEKRLKESERAERLLSLEFVEEMKTRLLPCAFKLFEKPNDEQTRIPHDERPCPSCRAPFTKDLLFWRRAFEPTDAELDADNMSDGIRVIGQRIIDDSDDDVPVKHRGRGGPKSTTIPGMRKSSASVEQPDDLDDSLSDFIVESDEDEGEKDARKAARRKNKGKRPAKRRTVEDEFDERGAGTDFSFKRNQKGKAGTVARFLPSTKMKAMMKSLKAWRKSNPEDKTIVISQFVAALDVVASYLEEQHFQYVRYQGTMSTEARQNAVKKFMNTAGPTVMLMSLKAGGVGLNLTRANRVISLDLGWSEAIEAQAFDRVHRLGQQKGKWQSANRPEISLHYEADVLVERLVIQNTIEDRILSLHQRKRGLADHSLGEGSGQKINKLSVRDLMELFGPQT